MNPTYAIGGSPLRVEGTSRTSMQAATTRVRTVVEEVTLPMFSYHGARRSKVLVDKRGGTRDDRRQPTGTHLLSALIASALTLTLGVLLFTPLAAARPLTPAPDADGIAGPAIGSELADGGHTAPPGIRRPPEVDVLALADIVAPPEADALAVRKIVAPPEADALAPRVDRTGAGMWQWWLGDTSFFVPRTAP